jgi:fucose permease
MTLITLGSIMPSLNGRFVGEEINKKALVALLPGGLLLGSLVFGPIVDRYGYKLLLILSVVVSVLALEGVAFTDASWILYLSIFFIGFGGGIINGGTSALVADISSENKGANLSLLGVFFGIGALGMPLLLGLMSKYFSQETILSITGLFMLIPVIFFLWVKFPAPKQAQGFPLKEGIGLFRKPALLLMGFFLFFQSGIEALVNNWITSFLQTRLGISDRNALYALSFTVVGLTIARLLLGGLMKKFSSYILLLVSLGFVFIGCGVIAYTENFAIAFGALILTGLGLAAGFPVILGYVGQLYTSLSGTAFSIALVIALTGNIILNFSFGLIAENYSIKYLPILVMACVVCMTFILIAIRGKIAGKVKL